MAPEITEMVIHSNRSHSFILIHFDCFFRITPSADCGPFRGQSKAYDVVLTLIDSWKDDFKVLYEIVKVVSSPGAIAVVLILLWYIMAIFHHTVKPV